MVEKIGTMIIILGRKSQKKVLSKLNYIIQKLNTMAVTLDQTLQSVRDNATVGDSVIALLTDIKKRLDDALSGTTLPPEVQAKVDAIFQASEDDKAKLEAAILANTPSEGTGSVEGAKETKGKTISG